MSTAGAIRGGCLCGAVRYEVRGVLHAARSCHCSRCRKAFGGAASAYAEVGRSDFAWTEGEECVGTYETMPGWGLGFCRTCGSTLCGFHDGRVHGVTLGCVDGDPGVAIEMHLFVGSKAPWDEIGGDAPRFEEWPPPAR